MADKSFEQQVRIELSELRMKPAASVWPVVEAALHKERKRRWLIWLFLLAGCAGASFWGYYHFRQDEETVAKIPVQIQSLPKEEPKEKEITKAKDTPLAIPETQIQKRTAPVVTAVAESTKEESRKTSFKEDVTSAGKNIPVKTQTNQNVLADLDNLGKTFPASKQDKKVFDDAQPQSAKIIDKINDDSNPVNNSKQDPEKETAKTQQITSGKDSMPVTVKNDEKEPVTLSATPNASGEAPAAAAVVKTKKNKWQWNIAVDAGSSGLRNVLSFDFNKSVAFAVAAPVVPGNSIPQSSTEPTVKDAFSFGIQLQATKQLGKKHQLGLSAGYSLFQTTMNVGQRIDSATLANSFAGTVYSSYYYTNSGNSAFANNGDYTNKYHFLRLGADLYTPFRLFKSIHFQWQLGAGMNILAATNGLHYDPVTKRSFQNNALYAKAQSYISTGIDLSIGKQPFLYIGPHWQYSFTNLTSRPGGDQHLFLSSVRVSYVLPKKKK